MAKTGLGKGLGALIGGNALAAPQPVLEKGERIQDAPLTEVVPSPYQPRKQFREEQLAELVASIRERGIIQPLIVRLVDGKFELIAGERRWRAAQRAGLAAVPVIVRSASDREVLELALVENLQRSDLNPFEEAEAYALLISQFHLTQEEVAARVGKNRASVANAIRLLSLPPEIRAWIENGQLSVGHAKVILGLTKKDDQILAAERIIKDGLTVRSTEKLIASLQSPATRGKTKKTSAKLSNAAWTDIEKRLQQAVGTRVKLIGSAETGRIELQYFSGSDLERLLKLLGLRDF
jgi:ParB family chromosome partitioning protein